MLKEKFFKIYGPIAENPKTKLGLIVFILLILIVVTKVPIFNFVITNQIQNNANLHNPSFKELMDFTRENNVDKTQYNLVMYNCVCFSRDLLDDAREKGIKGYFVVIDDPETVSYHAIVMFNTTDEGEIYIEPQTDAIIEQRELDIVKIL